MAIRRFSTSNLSGGKSSKLWDQETTPGYFESIATAVGNGSSVISFTNIPQNYSHLQLRVLMRSTANYNGDGINMSFNNDGNSNYVLHRLYGNGSSAAADYTSATTTNYQVGFIPGATISANIFGVAVIDILDYTNTNKNKVVRSLTGFDVNSTPDQYIKTGLVSGLWLSTAAINRLDISGSGGYPVTNSHVALYGIRGA